MAPPTFSNEVVNNGSPNTIIVILLSDFRGGNAFIVGQTESHYVLPTDELTLDINQVWMFCLHVADDFGGTGV